MPTGGDWGNLKREATAFARKLGSEPVSPASLLRDYIRVKTHHQASLSGLGVGSVSVGSGKGGGGGGGGGGGRAFAAGAGVAQNVGGFLSRVTEAGLRDALREVGLEKLSGRPAAEVAAALLDALAGPASTLDQAAARQALADLNEELLAGAKTFEDVEAVLNQAVDERGLGEILGTFLGLYVYECFCRDFYERLVARVGSEKAANTVLGRLSERSWPVKRLPVWIGADLPARS